jgi:uncharacterized repeat protein (TIGR03803 family)
LASSKTAFRTIAFALLSAGIAASAQTFTTLHKFDGTDGSYPTGGLVQATDGNLYGTTEFGGDGFGGNVFRITPSGTVTSLYSFCSGIVCPEGSYPVAGLVQGTDGNLYGTTLEGGTTCLYVGTCGIVFRTTLAGTLTVLHRFHFTDGAIPPTRG